MSVEKDILMGNKPGNLHCQAIRTRASEIVQTMNQLLYTLQYAPSTLQWCVAFDLSPEISPSLSLLNVAGLMSWINSPY